MNPFPSVFPSRRVRSLGEISSLQIRLLAGIARLQSESQTMKHFKSRKCRIFLLFQSLFLICSGLFWLFIFPIVFKEILESKLIIKEGTPAYDAWKKPSLPTKLRWWKCTTKKKLKAELFLGFFYFLWKILPGLKKERNQIWNKSGLLSSKEISSRSRHFNL